MTLTQISFGTVTRKIFWKTRDRSLVGNISGVALVGFSFTAPILMILGMATLETANLAFAHIQVNKIAERVADKASIVGKTIDEADVHGIFSDADHIGQNIGFSQNGRVILSSLEDNGNSGVQKGQWIRWQRCFGKNTKFSSTFGMEGDGKTDASLVNGIGPSGRKIKAPGTKAINFVEVQYDYRPLISGNIFGDIVIKYQAAYVSQHRDDHALKNADPIPDADLLKCHRYSAITQR